MTPNLHISHLEGPALEAAFPLVWVSAPDLDRRQWSQHCDHLVRLGGGILGAAAEDGALLGIAAYRPDRHLRHGAILRVDMLVAFELAGADEVRSALYTAVELIAHGLGAGGVALTVPGRGYGDPGSSKSEKWARLGLELDSVGFTRTFAPAAARRPAPQPDLV